jgi:hypothetical protein
LGVGVLRILRILGILGWKTENKTCSAQQDSEISILTTCPLCPYCLLCPLVLKTTPAQRDSEISKLRIPIDPIGPIKNNITATKNLKKKEKVSWLI